MEENTIFVQIASYRDPQLIPTLNDLINNADNPKNLHICIAHQHSKEDTWDVVPTLLRRQAKFTVLDIDYKDSLGACWARNKIQQEYSGEKYTLQLDSHHRFIKGWDTELINMLTGLQDKGHPKPLITSYIPSFNPDKDPEGRVMTPWAMTFDRFTPEGIIFFLPYYVENPTEPIPARFFSAHFVFTLGEHARDVQHDPELYFHGEEISLAVRSWTHGYDLFHPHKVIAWHEYTRVGRTKHWDDDSKWYDKNTAAHQRVRTLLGVDDTPCYPCNEAKFGNYYLGKERTLEQWEETMGIKFSNRSIQQAVRDNLPPMKRDQPFNTIFRHPLEFNKSKLTHNDYEWFAIIFEDKDNNPLYRRDETNVNILNQENIIIWEEYQGPKPHKWIVWPYSKSIGWVDKIEVVL